MLVLVVLSGKGILVCLAMGHVVQVKGCLVENFTGIAEIPFIFTKGTCPNLACHKSSLLKVEVTLRESELFAAQVPLSQA